MMDKITDVSLFVSEHYQPWRNADINRLRDYFSWYDHLGILGVVGCEGAIDAVITCRGFDDPADYWVEFVHRPWGKYVKCSVWGAVHSRFIPNAVQQIQARHKYREDRIFLWHRDHIELGPPRQYSAHQFKRILDKLAKL